MKGSEYCRLAEFWLSVAMQELQECIQRLEKAGLLNKELEVALYIEEESPQWFKVNKIKVSHEDERRAITAAFNGDFVAKQVKILEIKKDSILGNHYHDYRELFYILEGLAIYQLENIVTHEVCSLTLWPGDRLIIEPKVAHRVEMAEGTLTVEATEEPYISPEYNDKRYEIKCS